MNFRSDWLPILPRSFNNSYKSLHGIDCLKYSSMAPSIAPTVTGTGRSRGFRSIARRTTKKKLKANCGGERMNINNNVLAILISMRFEF